MSGLNFFKNELAMAVFFFKECDWSFNEVISLTDQAVSMETPTAGMIGSVCKENLCR